MEQKINNILRRKNIFKIAHSWAYFLMDYDRDISRVVDNYRIEKSPIKILSNIKDYHFPCNTIGNGMGETLDPRDSNYKNNTILQAIILFLEGERDKKTNYIKSGFYKAVEVVDEKTIEIMLKFKGDNKWKK